MRGLQFPDYNPEKDLVGIEFSDFLPRRFQNAGCGFFSISKIPSGSALL